ncbi:MAG: tetratricopeptide repeat protein [Pseudomonadota bacterium]
MAERVFSGSRRPGAGCGIGIGVGRWLAGGALLALAGCQTTGYQGNRAVTSSPETIRICDATGCFDAPSDYASYDPSQAVPEDDPNGLLPFLIPEAEADPRAAHDLALRYMRGDGIRRQPYEAIRWMRDAAGRGNVDSQAALGKLYLTGLEETGADYAEAVKWLELAAANGNRESRRLLDEARELRDSDTARLAWRDRYTYPSWYRSRYYGTWRGGRYAYY